MRPVSLVLLPLLAACSGAADTQEVDRRLVVAGNDMSPRTQNILLVRGTSPVSNALVTVNGTQLTETVAGQYAGQLPSFLAEGSQVQLMIIAAGDTIVGTATVPAAPRLLAPASGTVIHFPDPLDFTWISSADPDEFQGAIQYADGAEISRFPGAARSGVVVSSRLPHPISNLSAYLYAYNNGTFTGPARPDSKMHVRQVGGVVGVTLVQ